MSQVLKRVSVLQLTGSGNGKDCLREPLPLGRLVAEADLAPLKDGSNRVLGGIVCWLDSLYTSPGGSRADQTPGALKAPTVAEIHGTFVPCRIPTSPSNSMNSPSVDSFLERYSLSAPGLFITEPFTELRDERAAMDVLPGPIGSTGPVEFSSAGGSFREDPVAGLAAGSLKRPGVHKGLHPVDGMMDRAFPGPRTGASNTWPEDGMPDEELGPRAGSKSRCCMQANGDC